MRFRIRLHLPHELLQVVSHRLHRVGGRFVLEHIVVANANRTRKARSVNHYIHITKLNTEMGIILISMSVLLHICMSSCGDPNYMNQNEWSSSSAPKFTGSNRMSQQSVFRSTTCLSSTWKPTKTKGIHPMEGQRTTKRSDH